VDDGFYDGIIWHRVGQSGDEPFVIQTGLIEREDDELVPRDDLLRDPIASEAPNGQSNLRLTVAMALRGQDADSATSQFFISVTDNEFLDEGPPSFTVFARVVEGEDVVDEIAASEITSDPVAGNEVPVEDIVMTTIQRR
jgi:peptidyl-prolyl cis-trans isomerase A (cyclophilin A)